MIALHSCDIWAVNGKTERLFHVGRKSPSLRYLMGCLKLIMKKAIDTPIQML